MAERRAAIFGTEKDQQNCPFYLKIGACRHGDRCSRLHNKPVISQTILLPNLYQSPISKKAIEAAGGQAPNLTDTELQQHFDEFYEDIFEGLAKYGQVDLLNVCANLGDHLVGNVYVKYQKEDDANESIKGLKGRFYDGRPIISEFSPVTDFTEARCRQYDIGTCNRGGFCNFMHLHNPSKSLYYKLFGDRKSRSPSPKRENRDRGDYGGGRRGGGSGGGYERDYRDRDYGGSGGRRGYGDRDYRDRDYGGRYDRDRDYRDRDYGRSSSRDSYDRDRDRRPYHDSYDRNGSGSRGSKSPDHFSRPQDLPPPPSSSSSSNDSHYNNRPQPLSSSSSNNNNNTSSDYPQPGSPSRSEQPPLSTTTTITTTTHHSPPDYPPPSTTQQTPLSTGSTNGNHSGGTQHEIGEKRGRDESDSTSPTSEKRLKDDHPDDQSNGRTSIQWASETTTSSDNQSS